MFVLMRCRPSSNISHVCSKARSLGQIEGESCKHCRSHIFCFSSLKIGQNVSLNDIYAKLYGSQQVKNNRSLGQMKENLVNALVRIILFMCFALEITLHISDERSRAIIALLVKNVCLNDIQAECEYGSYWVKNQVIRSN